MIVSNGYRKNGFDAFGGKFLRKSDMGYWMNHRKRTDPRGVCLELGEEVEKVERGFFELLPTVNELWILNPNADVRLSKEDAALFLKNNVLVRGEFDSAAEAFAQKYGLRFLLINTKLGSAGDYYEQGVDIITLRLYPDSSADIHQDCRCQGISAGNTGGGEVSFDLPEDFYLTMTPEEVAGKCWSSCYSSIIEQGILASVMAKAKTKNGFLLDYTKKA